MRDRIISDVTEYFPATDEQQTPVHEEHDPAVLAESSNSSDLFSRPSTRVEASFTYSYKRFPTMSYLEYHNSVFLHIESNSDGSVTLQMLPGGLATTKSTQLYSSVFLSHSHRDKVFARKLANDLRISKIRVWIDEAEIKIGAL